MVKHTQTIRWLLPTNSLSVFDFFVLFALKSLTRCCNLKEHRSSYFDIVTQVSILNARTTTSYMYFSNVNSSIKTHKDEKNK